MKFEKFNRDLPIQRVLIAPLDWGLGHATRCIPIIYELLGADLEVIIAASGKIKNLLEKEFPKLQFVCLKGYNVKYSNNKWWLPFKLSLQFPKILNSIYQEHQWLKKIIALHKIDAVISDNRLGLYHVTTPCAYITHQLKIKTGNRFTEWLAQKIHYFFINQYTVCWVPDNESTNDLAGELSHPEKMPKIPVQYLGPLSRFKKNIVEKKYDYLAILSGPEPQRTIFENILIKEFSAFHGKALLVRGLPGQEEELLIDNAGVETKNHLIASDLNKAMLQSGFIICRSGYTSIMDICTLQQKAILVPTPGQTEQEYLATYLQQQHIFPAIPQHLFTLSKATELSHSFSFTGVTINQEKYKMVIRDFINPVQQNQ